MADAMAYIDGLNLYYGALKNRPALKWLNPFAMVERLVPQDEIRLVRYFSALTVRTHSDPTRQRVRQCIFGRYELFPN